MTEWMAYFSLEPFGEERSDLRAGIIASTVANVNRGKGKAYKPQDFIPKFHTESQPQPEQSWEEQLHIAEMINLAFGGQDLRKV